MNAIEERKVINPTDPVAGILTISSGHSRTATKWKNEQVRWSDLLLRFESPTRTQETFKEYRAMTKAQQGEVKDVGGFVAGGLSGGRRKAQNVLFRSALTLDLDYLKESPKQFWESLSMFYGFEATAHTTHSHRPKAPRLRLVIPLSRAVTPEEYEAVGRKLAEELGMEYFDPTTFEPERLMYWPSVARDGEYIYLHNEGPWLDPDYYLEKYVDWRDTSFWPGLDRFHEKLVGDLKKQEDPLEKKGLIGAFCRTYSVTELLEKELSDIYAPTNVEGRWTFKAGSTAGGVVVYDDKFAYSHHATDPISGHLVNAFDLMRIHKFGAMDADAKEGTPVNRLPSFTKMEELINEDKEVKVKYIEEMRQDQEDLEDGLSFEEDELEWQVNLDMKGNSVASTVHNCRLIMENDPLLKGRYHFDEFRGRAIVTKALPWQSGKDRDWNDTDDAGFRNYLERNYGITGVQKIYDGTALAFETHKVHPVREYLESLTWDGKKRLATALVDYLGAENTPYVRAVSTLHMVASVARILRPGVKYDNMLVLLGPQGLGKSTYIRLLAKNKWFNDSIDKLQGKETFELLQGNWLIELGELNATRKAEKEAVKQFLSKTDDIFRAPYGRRTHRYPRQCTFWGSGNEVEFLRDETGDRRYFPVMCKEVEPVKSIFKGLESEVDQLWAEAVVLYKEGHPLYLDSEMEQLANEIRAGHKEDRPKVGMVREFLDTPVPMDWYERSIPERLNYLRGLDDDLVLFEDGEEPETFLRDKICIAEVWCELFGKRLGDLKPIESKEIGDILRNIDGWRSNKNPLRFNIYGRQRGFIRIE